MKITHVCPFVGEQMGGSERYVFNLSKRQAREYNVHIFTTTMRRNRVGTQRLNGVTFHRFYSPVIVWNINPLSMMLRPLVRSDSDIFHIHSYLYTLSNQTIMAKLMRNRKALLQIHGGIGPLTPLTSWTKFIVKQFYDATLGRFTIQNSDIVASVSRSDLDAIGAQFSIPRNRLRYVPNAIDTSIFLPRFQRNEEELTFLYVGDLEPWKGVGALIKWLSAYDQWDGFDFRVRFVGQGSLIDKLRYLEEKSLRLKSRIQIEVLGPRNHCQIPGIMRDADALILPSYWEGMPTVLLEAMASGTLVISTRVGDVPNFIQNLDTGLLIDRTLPSFKEAVQKVYSEEKTVARITKTARRLVEESFSLTHAYSALKNLYSEIAS